MIEVKNLTKKYGNHLAVKGISFTVEEGHIYGFLGPNGAGKSTTMNIITGCLAATSGNVTIDGHDIYEEPLEAKRCIGYLPEQPPLYFDMTPFEYLMFVAEAKGIDYESAFRQTREVIEATRLTEHQNRLIRNLSKGYKQRVGIAQAMLGNPKVIILDEPTVGLDPKQIIEIRDLIRELGRDKTIILSSHIMQEVQAVCDRVMIISNGNLVASDNIENLESLVSRTNKLHISVRCDEETAEEVLMAINGVERMSMMHTKDEGVLDITLDTDRAYDPRDDIFFAMADRRCAIIAMRYEESTLEDIFLRLTDSDREVPASEEETEKEIFGVDLERTEYTSQFSTAGYSIEDDENGKGGEE
ncbi:MAG: ATP-binding cassette domain-containing protein [Clostridia bacterium]|nr:ATP-binding cassette domain-containing protein [Clostridia bacterium]